VQRRCNCSEDSTGASGGDCVLHGIIRQPQPPEDAAEARIRRRPRPRLRSYRAAGAVGNPPAAGAIGNPPAAGPQLSPGAAPNPSEMLLNPSGLRPILPAEQLLNPSRNPPEILTSSVSGSAPDINDHVFSLTEQELNPPRLHLNLFGGVWNAVGIAENRTGMPRNPPVYSE
jgi:hypothetical protein